MGGLIKLFTAPIRSIVRFPLVQLAGVVALITFLQAADDNTAFGQIFNILDKLVDSTVRLISAIFNVKSFTRSWLISGFMIAYIYLACLLLLSFMRLLISAVVDFIGRSNAFWLRDAIARERGIAAYRAWVPLERIRPAHIPQEQWEETFAWPANNRPPYPPLPHRIVREAISYVIFVVAAAALLQAFTPFPALTRLAQLLVGLATSAPLLFIIVAAATVYGFVKWRGRSPRAKIAGSMPISVSPKMHQR
jgi:small-conductance mechanosensitive channel